MGVRRTILLVATLEEILRGIELKKNQRKLGVGEIQPTYLDGRRFLSHIIKICNLDLAVGSVIFCVNDDSRTMS